jgi:hypothetical protein
MLDELLAVLLSTAAVVVVLGGLIAAVVGPHEVWETRLWVIAVFVGLPGGTLLAREQRRQDAVTPPGVAAAALALLVGIVSRRLGDGSVAYNVVLVLAGVAATLVPFAVRGRPARCHDDRWRILTGVALAAVVVPFLPHVATRAESILHSVLVAAVVLLSLCRRPRLDLTRPAYVARDVLLGALLFLIAFRAPDLADHSYALVHHHDFYLGPVNDVAHGGSVPVDVWSQYGIGMIDVLRAAFWVLPLGYGGMVLLLSLATAVQSAVLFATLRAATARVGLAFAGVLVTLLVPASSVDYPSTGPLRFGTPYLVIGLAVVAARRPQIARYARWGQLAVAAGAALWSFEAFTYTLATATAISLVERLAGEAPRLRLIVRDLAQWLAVAVGALALFTAAVAVFAGTPHWGPYTDYIRLYTKGFGALPVTFFSPGPLMGAATILSAAGLGWVVLQRRVEVPTTARVTLAGFTGFAISSYTYYLGRSATANLTHLLPPVAAYATVWVDVFLGPPRRVPRVAPALAAAALVLAGSAITVNVWPAFRSGFGDTALAQLAPGADPWLGRSVRRLADLPTMDPRANAAVAAIDLYVPAGAPVLVLMSADLTTETLLRSRRRNLLPISNPIEDDLIDSSDGRVLAAVARVPPGTLMLLDDRASGGAPANFRDGLVPLQRLALRALRARFALAPVERGGGVQVVWLVRR